MWLHEKQAFVSRLLASGGELQVIVELPGAINIGDNLKLETMSLAVKLGVSIGVKFSPSFHGQNRMIEDLDSELRPQHHKSLLDGP